MTFQDLGRIGSRPRNRVLVDHVRDFPTPPNLDAGEGVRMMRATMEQANLYPPVFSGEEDLGREAVAVAVLNSTRPSAWEQVSEFLTAHGQIGNAEVRQLMRTDNPVAASRTLRSWVDSGLLVLVDPGAAKQNRKYRFPGGAAAEEELFTRRVGKQMGSD